MYLRTYICTYIHRITFCLLFIATICFNETSISIIESQESLVFTIMITNPLSTDMTVTVATTNGTAIGEVNITVIMYIAIYNAYT